MHLWFSIWLNRIPSFRHHSRYDGAYAMFISVHWNYSIRNVFFLFNTDCDCHRAYRNLYQKINAQAVDQTSVRIFDRIMMRTSMLRKKKKTTCISTTIFFHIFFCIDIGFIYSKKKKKYLVFSTIKDIQCLMIKIRTINILVIEVSVFFHVSLYN